MGGRSHGRVADGPRRARSRAGGPGGVRSPAGRPPRRRPGRPDHTGRARRHRCGPGPGPTATRRRPGAHGKRPRRRSRRGSAARGTGRGRAHPRLGCPCLHRRHRRVPRQRSVPHGLLGGARSARARADARRPAAGRPGCADQASAAPAVPQPQAHRAPHDQIPRQRRAPGPGRHRPAPGAGRHGRGDHPRHGQEQGDAAEDGPDARVELDQTLQRDGPGQRQLAALPPAQRAAQRTGRRDPQPGADPAGDQPEPRVEGHGRRGVVPALPEDEVPTLHRERRLPPGGPGDRGPPGPRPPALLPPPDRGSVPDLGRRELRLGSAGCADRARQHRRAADQRRRRAGRPARGDHTAARAALLQPSRQVRHRLRGVRHPRPDRRHPGGQRQAGGVRQAERHRPLPDGPQVDMGPSEDIRQDLVAEAGDHVRALGAPAVPARHAGASGVGLGADAGCPVPAPVPPPPAVHQPGGGRVQPTINLDDILDFTPL